MLSLTFPFFIKLTTRRKILYNQTAIFNIIRLLLITLYKSKNFDDSIQQQDKLLWIATKFQFDYWVFGRVLGLLTV